MKEYAKFGGQLLAVILLYMFVWAPFAIAFGVQWVVRQCHNPYKAALAAA